MNRIGKEQLDLDDLQYLLKLYNYNNIYKDYDNNYLHDGKFEKFLIKSNGIYYTMVVNNRKQTVNIIDPSGEGNYDEDLKKLSTHVTSTDGNNYEVMYDVIEVTHPQATDIIALITFMASIKITQFALIDNLLIELLFKDYIKSLVNNNASIIEEAYIEVMPIKEDNVNDENILYDEVEYNSLNFLDKVRLNYQYNDEGVRYYGTEKDYFIKKVNEMMDVLDKDSMLNDDQFKILLHFMNSNNDHVVDPLQFYYQDKAKIKININGIYFFPVVKDLHWTLFEADYIKNRYIKITVYDSKCYFRNDSKERSEIVKSISSIFAMNSEEYELKVKYHESKLKQGKDNSCGYYVLFFLAARINFLDIEKIPNIESFNIDYFIKDIKKGLQNLDDNEKAKMYFYASKRPTYYKN